MLSNEHISTDALAKIYNYRRTFNPSNNYPFKLSKRFSITLSPI